MFAGTVSGPGLMRDAYPTWLQRLAGAAHGQCFIDRVMQRIEKHHDVELIVETESLVIAFDE